MGADFRLWAKFIQKSQIHIPNVSTRQVWKDIREYGVELVELVLGQQWKQEEVKEQRIFEIDITF